jgi:hypothetical protein
MSLVIRGMAQTKAALRKAQLQIELATPTAVGQAGGVVAREMANRAMRDTGALANSIGVDVSDDTARVGASVPYDRYWPGYKLAAAEASKPGVVAAMIAVYRTAVT